MSNEIKTYRSRETVEADADEHPAITTDDIYRLMRVIEALNARVAELGRENRRLTSVPPSPDLPD